MKGILKYHPPFPEENTPGGWYIHSLEEQPFKQSFSLCDKTKQWIEENNPPLESEVEYNVLPLCNYSETDKKGYHKMVASIIKKSPKFKVGDKAVKPKGYPFPCTIIGVFENLNGDIRVVGEMDEYGLLHIFNEEQLEHIK